MDKPYVGVTGIVSVAEVDYVAKQFGNLYANINSHSPAIGFLTSNETLKGVNSNRRFPDLKTINALLERTPQGISRVIHYKTKDTKTLANQIARLFGEHCCEDLCDIIQLNMPFEETNQISIINSLFGIKIALKIPNYNLSVKEIANKVSAYGNSINYALIELPENRQGIFNIDAQINLYNELSSRPAGWIVGFVGGFTAWNTEERLSEMISKVGSKNFCIDAVGGLRDKITSEKNDDLLDHKKVKQYLKSVASVLR